MHDTYWEYPLEGEREAPGPLVFKLVGAESSAGNNDLADGPAHLQGRRAGASEREGDNFTGVGRRVCNKHAPGDTFKCLSNNKKRERVCLC